MSDFYEQERLKKRLTNNAFIGRLYNIPYLPFIINKIKKRTVYLNNSKDHFKISQNSSRNVQERRLP